MKLEEIEIPDNTGSIKATIHISGKLGFSQPAIAYIHIQDNKYLKIFVNKEDKKDTNLYVSFFNSRCENCLQISKAGKYYYANAKSIFDKMNVEYKKKKIIYDIVEIDYEGNKMYKFLRRDRDREKE